MTSSVAASLALRADNEIRFHWPKCTIWYPDIIGGDEAHVDCASWNIASFAWRVIAWRPAAERQQTTGGLRVVTQ